MSVHRARGILNVTPWECDSTLRQATACRARALLSDEAVLRTQICGHVSGRSRRRNNGVAIESVRIVEPNPPSDMPNGSIPLAEFRSVLAHCPRRPTARFRFRFFDPDPLITLQPAAWNATGTCKTPFAPAGRHRSALTHHHHQHHCHGSWTWCGPVASGRGRAGAVGAARIGN